MEESKIAAGERVEYLDVARGLTILMIIAFHVLGETNLVYHHFVDTMGLQVFLFVTGYFLKRFSIKKNIQKLVIPYIALLVFVRCYWDIRSQSGFNTQMQDLLKQILMGYTYDELWQGNGVFVGIAWFFPLLAACRLLYVLIGKISKDNFAVKGSLCFCLCCAGVVIGMTGIRLPWNLDVAMASLPFLFMGNLARVYRGQFTEMYKKIWILTGFFIVWGVMIHFYGYSELATRRYPNGVTFLVTSSLAMFIVIGISYLLYQYLPKVCKIFIIYGEYSMAVLP